LAGKLRTIDPKTGLDDEDKLSKISKEESEIEMLVPQKISPKVV